MGGPLNVNTRLPVTLVSIQETIKEKSLDECVDLIKQQLHDLKYANENIRHENKKIVQLDKVIKKGKLSLSQDTTVESTQMQRSRRSIEISQAQISTAKEVLAAYQSRIQRGDRSDPKIKKLTKLLEKVTKEAHQQDELSLRKIEKELSKITGNKVFNAIFRIKAISSKERFDVTRLREDLDKLTEKGVDPSFKPRIEELKLKLGRALLLGHGIRTQKDVPAFLHLTSSELNQKNIDANDAKLMRFFIEQKYPTIDTSVKKEIEELKRGALSSILFHKGREFSKKDLPKLREAARELQEVGRAIPSKQSLEFKAFLGNRKALAEAFLKVRGFKLPVDYETYLRNLEATFPRLTKEEAVQVKYELSYLGALNAKNQKAQDRIYEALGKALLNAYGFKTPQEQHNFPWVIADMATRKEIVLDRQELLAIYEVLKKEHVLSRHAPSIDDIFNYAKE